MGEIEEWAAETLAVFDRVGAAGEPLTTREVTEQLDCTRRAAYDRLQRLVDRETLGTKKVGARGRIWWPTATQFAGAATDGPTASDAVGPDRRTSSHGDRTRRQYEAAVETISDGVYIVDDESRFVFVNRAHTELTGYDRDELLGAHASLVTSDRNLARAERRRDELLTADEEVTTVETELCTKAGELIPIETRFALFTFSDGRVGRVGVVREITERKRHERELERYERIVETTNDLIYTLDEDLTFTSFNPATAAFVERSEDTLVGEHLSSAFGGEHTEALADATTRLLAEEATETTVETTLVDRRGEERQFQTTISVRPSDRQVGELVCVGRDITDLQERERRLSVFDRVLRHNLRNKMNIVQAWSEMLTDDPTEETVSDAARAITEASDELLALAQSVREFDSVLDAGATDLVATTDVAEHVREVASEARLSYPAASISVTTPDSVAARAHEAFELAVNELVDNAVKHGGEQPSVHLSVTVDDESDTVVVRVADDGPGIPPLERRSVTAGEESPLQHTNGLGLWFVRWMATNSGGSMRIEDNDPTGAVVELRLPKG